MKLNSTLWPSSVPNAKIKIAFIGQNGKTKVKQLDIRMNTTVVSNNSDYETIFMPSVNGFANTIAAMFAAVSTANVDVSVEFVNPYALVNSNIGDWGSGDVFESLSLSVYLTTDKYGNIGIPAPEQTLFLDTDGPNRDVFDVTSATSGLILPIMEAIAQLPADTDDSIWVISDGERVDDSVGYNGVRLGKRVVSKFVGPSTAP